MRTMSYWDRVKALAWALKGDGCSKAPDLFYHSCCDEHDIAYRTGATVDGKRLTRKQADARFLACLKKNGKIPILGTLILPYIYWSMVRLFGESAWDNDKPFYAAPETD